MAKIFISFFSGTGSDTIPCFYEGFIKALIEEGNQVAFLVTNDFLVKPWDSDNEIAAPIQKELLLNKIRELDPDLVISFNNSIPKGVREYVNCPYIIFEADTYSYFSEKEQILANPERYHIFCASPEKLKLWPDDYRILKNRLHQLSFATHVKAQSLDQDKNISFIGTNFQPTTDFAIRHQKLSANDKAIFKTLYQEFYQDAYIDYEQCLSKLNASHFKTLFDKKEFWQLVSSRRRTRILENIAMLGLHLYGVNWDNEELSYFPLGIYYHDEHVYSLQHNQDIYNSSKVCLNINHAQAKDMFPWRVLDILASNGCLVTEKSENLSRFLKGYIDLPTYSNELEAYDLTRRILADKTMRHEISAACQQAVNDKGRWTHRFREISDIVGVPLLKQPSDETTQSKEPAINTRTREQPVRVEVDSFIKPYFKVLYFLITLATKFIPRRFHKHCYKILLALGIKINYEKAIRLREAKPNNLRAITKTISWENQFNQNA